MSVLNLIIELFIDGAWVAFPGYAADGWSTQIGPNPESGTQPSKVTFALQSDNHEMDPANPSSPYYGKIGRNTPCRLKQGADVLFTGEVSSWAPDATIEHVAGVRGKSWVDVTGEGVLRRLGRWTDPLQSPMVRQTLSYPGLLGYWPMEDDSGAQNLQQVATVSATGATFAGTVTLAGADGAGGAARAVTIGADGVLYGTFAAATGNGYQLAWVAKLATLPASASYSDILIYTDTVGRTWSWQANNINYRMTVTEADGSMPVDLSYPFATRSPDQWIWYRWRVTVSGSTITVEPAWRLQDDVGPIGATTTFTGTATGRPRGWTVVGNAITTGAAFGHLFSTTDTAVNLVSGDAARAFNGYRGESAFNRYYRLLGEQGNLGRNWTGDNTKTKPMGRQKPGLFLDLLQEAVRTDGGLLYDHPSAVWMCFRMLNSIVGQTPVLVLDKSDLAPGLRKVIDDVNGYNDVTGQNWDGTKVRIEQSTGTMSTAPPPAGVGRYKGTLDLSLRDYPDLVQRTGFELMKTTIDRPRYPSITVDLLNRPGLRTAINALRPGDLLSLTGVEPAPIPLILMTISRSGGAVADFAKLDCVPADVYLPARYDDFTSATLYDLRTSTLGAAASSSATSLTIVTTSDAEEWSAVSGYGLLIAGERVTVTAMTGRTGTGPYTQTATVVRAVNGVAKALPMGAPVHVATPGRYGI